MEDLKLILQVAQAISPLGIIFLLVVVIYNMTAGKNFTAFFRKSAVDEKGEKITIESLHLKLNKIATNHLHGLPEMERTLERIEQGQKDMTTAQTRTNEILIEVKTLLTSK